MLTDGLRGDWGSLPTAGVPVTNFLKCPAARIKCRDRFKSEVEKGRMIGGPGWSAEAVRSFLRAPFFCTPCGAVPKKDDPYGRIIHNYSHKIDGISLNDCLLDNSTEYISFKDRVRLLDPIKWYIKLDLKDGYRQLAVHPSEWRTQVYTLGPAEHYIDIAMPFGKANSSKLFCRWASLWFKSCIARFNQQFNTTATLGSYVDDAFGGATSRRVATRLITYITAAGSNMATLVNTKKTEGPATSMVILGLQYCSRTKVCSLDPAKVTKYTIRISQLLNAGFATSKFLEQLVGNLEFAAWVEPFGRPLLTFVRREIVPDSPTRTIHVTRMMRIALGVWQLLMARNRGLRFQYILDAMPMEHRRMYVDAASTKGIGGYSVSTYFLVSNRRLAPYLRQCDGWSAYPHVDIAWVELLAAYVAIDMFAARSPGKYLIMYSDNTNVVAWLSSRRPPNPFVGALVAAIERLKYNFFLKLSIRYIPSKHNVSADLLSRQIIPARLQKNGNRIHPNLRRLCSNLIIDNIYPSWAKTVQPSSFPVQA